MAFRVLLLQPTGGTVDEYEAEGTFTVIEGGALRVHRPSAGTTTVYSPNWWVKVEEDPEEGVLPDGVEAHRR
jgi:hypothetical protein